MVAIFTGLGSGLERGSASVLGSAGLLGSSALGRGGEDVFLNAATGNLVIKQQDEFLVGLGPDAAITRTYSYKQGSAGGSYIVQGGETLQGIAQATWGDASLWYKIAEANGLSGDAPLLAGQALNLPAGVTRSKNNASTFKPYDAAEALGNTSPTTPKPPKKNKCGMFGQILLVAIAIAVATRTCGPQLEGSCPQPTELATKRSTQHATSRLLLIFYIPTRVNCTESPLRGRSKLLIECWNF